MRWQNVAHAAAVASRSELEAPPRLARVDRGTRPLVALRQVPRPALDHECRRDVQKHGLAPRARLALEEPRQHRRVRRRVASGERLDLDPGLPESVGLEPPRARPAVFDLDAECGDSGRELVEPVLGVKDDRALVAERRERVGEQARQIRPADADELARRARRVRERSERVEDRADAELAADRAELLHRRVERRREEEDETGLVEDPARSIWLELDGEPGRREHVRRADPRGDGSVAVLRDGGARSGRDDRRRRREIEEVAAEPARTARVEKRRPARRDPAHPAPERRDRSRDLLGSLAARRDPEKDRALLRLGRLAVHEIAERGLRQGTRQGPPRGDGLERFGDMRSHETISGVSDPPSESSPGSVRPPASGPTPGGTGRRTPEATDARAPSRARPRFARRRRARPEAFPREPRANGIARLRTAAATRRRVRCPRARSASSCHGAASERARSCLRDERRSPGGRGTRRAAALPRARPPRSSGSFAPRSRAGPGPGEITTARGRSETTSRRLEAIVARHPDVGVQPAQGLDEVERERVVVVDDEDHANHSRASSIARKSAAALASASAYSFSATESATMPAPACTRQRSPSIDRRPDRDGQVAVAGGVEVADGAAVDPASA